MKGLYLVVSYDGDEQWTAYDFILAEDDEKARKIVNEARPNSIAVSALSVEEINDFYSSAQAIDSSERREEFAYSSAEELRAALEKGVNAKE